MQKSWFNVGLVDFMIQENLELQKLIIVSLRNIDEIKNNDINVFASIPYRNRMPYIKVSGLKLKENQNACNVRTFAIELFVATNWKNNQQILKIMESIYNNLTKQAEDYANENNLTNINVYNIYNLHYEIEENFQNNTWSGRFYIDVDIV